MIHNWKEMLILLPGGRRVSLFSRSPGKIIFTDEKFFPVVVSYRWKNFPWLVEKWLLIFSCKILINSCLMSFCVLASANIFITFPLSFMFNNSSPWFPFIKLFSSFINAWEYSPSAIRSWNAELCLIKFWTVLSSGSLYSNMLLYFQF